LPESIKAKILTFPEHRMGAQRVALIYGDGRIVENVIVAWGEEVMSAGDAETGQRELRLQDVVDVENRA
jgi:hypothetical protein